MVKPVKFTDSDKFPRPYVPAEQSKAEGYLAKRFQEIREQQERDEAEKKMKLRQMRKA